MLMTRAACAAAYQYLGEKLEFLWSESLRINTVHVSDVAAAMWHVAVSPQVMTGSVWNLCDKGDTNQGKVRVVFLLLCRAIMM